MVGIESGAVILFLALMLLVGGGLAVETTVDAYISIFQKMLENGTLELWLNKNY